MSKHIKKFNDYIKENYSINENKTIENGLTTQGIIDFANTLGYYDMMDNEEDGMDSIEDAIKFIELESDYKVIKKDNDLYDIIELDYEDSEENNNNGDNIIAKINFNDTNLEIKLISDGGFENYLYADTEDGEYYVDISTNIQGNSLINAIWVKKGDIEEEIADKLQNILDKSNVITRSGFNQYIKYDIK